MSATSFSKVRTGGGLSKRVAVITDSFDVKYQATLVHHLRYAAEQRKIQLLVVPGGILNSPQRAARSRNRIYDLFGSACVDGIILLSPTISSQVGRVGMLEFCGRFQGLPLCSIGERIDGIPSVLVNNERGVRDMVHHLVVDHGHRHFAFIRGTPGNAEAELRFQAYCSELTALGIEPDTTLAPAGDFLLDSGRVAMQDLLARPGIQLDVVFACNDYMALGALEAIARQHPALLRPPAVVGYDNIDESNVCMPPLSTIEQPLAQMAETAVRCILSQIQGEEAPATYCLEPWLVLRRSCGCSSLAQRGAETIVLPAEAHSGNLELRFIRRRECILAEMSRTARGYFRGVTNWENALLKALVDELRGIPGGIFATAVSQLLRGLTICEGELWRLNDVLMALRIQTLQVLGDNSPERNRVEDLFLTARTLVSEAVVRVQAQSRLRIERLLRSINDVAVALGECTDTASLRHRLKLELPKLGIRQLIVVMFRRGAGEFTNQLASVFFALESHAQGAIQEPEPFPAKGLLSETFWAVERDRGFVVLPLFIGSESLGYVLVDFEIDHGAVLEVLRLQLSASLWRALLTSADVSASIAPITIRQVAHHS